MGLSGRLLWPGGRRRLARQLLLLVWLLLLLLLWLLLLFLLLLLRDSCRDGRLLRRSGREGTGRVG